MTDNRLIAWKKTRDFIVKHDIKFDKDNDPDFTKVAKSKNECIRMNKTYYKNWLGYIAYCEETFQGKKIEK